MGINQCNRWLIIAWMSLLTLPSMAQPHPANPGKVVLFLPLYLDSVFNEQQEYRYNKGEFPRFVSGPLEFYQGFEQAMDSLKARPGQIDVTVVDIRAANLSLPSLLENGPAKQAMVWLLFGNAAESRQIAEYAKRYRIPLLNLNLPNDAGITENPYYFMCNTTLETQCEGIYQHIQKNYPLHRILLVRKKGSMEDRILNIWEQYGRRTPGVPLPYTIIETTDTITSAELNADLDTNQKILLVGTSLDERFARNLATAASELRTGGYTIELMGLSTWDNVREFTTNRYRNLEVTIPTPFYYPKTDPLSKWLQLRFQNKNYGKISDLYLRGYELAWFLHPLLIGRGNELADRLLGKRKLLFAEMDWRPVSNTQTGQPDYLENKKLYFVKRMEGILQSVQ
jgi:hypothetical protein